MEIYVYKDGQQIGPFSREQVVKQLHHGIVKTTDLAWYDGLPDWKPLGEILASDLWEETTPEEPVKSFSHAGGWWKGLLAGALVAGAAFYLVLNHGRQPAPIAASSPEPVASPTVAVVVNQPTPTPQPVAVNRETPAPTVAEVQKQPAQEKLPDHTATAPSPEPATMPSATPTPTDAELFYTQAKALDKKREANKSDVEQAMALYRKSADLGNTLAMTALADLLRRQDFKQNRAESDELYARAASLGDPRALLFVAEKAQNAEDYLSLVTKSAMAGSFRACDMLKGYYLGTNYMAHRFQSTPNLTLALQWQIVWQFVGNNSSYPVQETMRKMSADEIQAAQHGADDFIAANHLKKGEAFEYRVQKLASYANPQAGGVVTSPTVTPQPVSMDKPSATPEVSGDKSPKATGLALDKNWKFGFKAEERAAIELKNLLNGHGKANTDMEPHPELTIYKSVTYLMPFPEAVKALNLGKQVCSKTQVKCPGWPASSFDFYGFAGLFDGHYNRLFLLVDRADHVVAVELVDETPKGQAVGYDDEKSRLFVYDFVQDQYRIDATCRVTQKAETDNDYKSLRIDSRFYGRNTVANKGTQPYHRTLSGSWSHSNSVLVLQEDVRLFLPQPIIDLILYHIK